MKYTTLALAAAVLLGAAGSAVAEQNFSPVPGYKPTHGPLVAQYQAGPNCGQSRCDGGFRCCSNYMGGGWSFWCCRATQQCGSYNDCR
jgi:hypothetical protein